MPVDVWVAGGDVNEAQQRGDVLPGSDVLDRRAPVLRVDDVNVDLS